MMFVIRRIIEAAKANKAELEESYRDEFETEAFASGEFKGVRFTRLSDGKYADDRLESTWRAWVKRAIQISMTI